MLRRFGCLLVLCIGAPAFSVMTYSRDIKPIFDNSCVECHDSLGHDPDLSNYPFDTIIFPSQEAVVDKVLEKTKSKYMPLGNRPKLTDAEIDKIQQWKNEGMAW